MTTTDQLDTITNDFFAFARSRLEDTNHFVYCIPNSQNKIDFSIKDDSEIGTFCRIEPIRVTPSGFSNSYGCFKLPITDSKRIHNAIQKSIDWLLFDDMVDKANTQRPTLSSLIESASARAKSQGRNHSAPMKELEH